MSTQKKQFLSLEEKNDSMEKYFEVEKQKDYFTCKECDSLSFQIVQRESEQT